MRDLTLFVDPDQLAWKVAGTTSPNPPVGCVLQDPTGRTIGRGATQPPGGPHAEVVALKDAAARGHSTEGTRAIVTLEPCNHTGRTGPCSQALIDAGVSRVDYLFSDPNPQAVGGAEHLRHHGVDVHGPYLPTPGSGEVGAVSPLCWRAPFAVEPWLISMTYGRPCVTLKLASTINGYVAATDSTSQWITGSDARAQVHRDRLRRDAIIVGTGTVAADSPRLTARDQAGEPYPAARQPLRVVLGRRAIADDAPIFDPPGAALHIHERDPHKALADLHQRGIVDVLVEGGPHISAAFLEAGVVDAIQLYQAPAVLPAGQPSLSAAEGATTNIADLRSFIPRSVETLGMDILWQLST